jgi:hypothetical protein
VTMARNLVTRLLGRLVINHGYGHIEFELRNPREIEKRGTKTIIRIVNTGDLPFLSDGRSFEFDCVTGKFSVVESEQDNKEAGCHGYFQGSKAVER